MFNNRFTKKDSVVDAVSQVLEAWDDDEDDDVRRADAELKRMKAKPIEADKKTDPDKEIGKLAKKTPKEVDESVEQIDELSKKTLANYMRANTKRMADPKNPDSMERKMKRHDDYFKASKKFHNEESEVNEDKWTDIADGPWKKSNRSKSSAASAAANAAGKGLKGAQHKLDVAEPKGKLTAADFKKLRKEDAEQIDEVKGSALGNALRRALTPKKISPEKIQRNRDRWAKMDAEKAAKANQSSGIQEKTLTPAESKKKEEIVKSMKKGAKGFKERYGKRAKEVMYATATKQAKKVAEEIESVDEKVKVKVSTDKPIGYKVSDIGPGKKEYNVKTDKAWDDEQKKKKTVSEAQGPTSTYGVDPNFVPPANTTSSPVLARAKELARGAMKRLNDSMMGKAGATSEEIDPSVKTTDTLVGRVKGGKDDDVGPKADGKSTKVKYTPGPK